MESLEIKAPFDGIVFEVSAQAGQTYQAEDILFIIGDPKALEVIANVTEEDYPLFAWVRVSKCSSMPVLK